MVTGARSPRITFAISTPESSIRTNTWTYHPGGCIKPNVEGWGPMRIIVLGLGYVGTITAAGLASKGHDVVGIDVDESKVDGIQRGLSPVVEPGIADLVAEGVASGRLRATTDFGSALDGADVSLVCVGTPSTSRGSTDLSYLTRALTDLREAMDGARRPRRSSTPATPSTPSRSRSPTKWGGCSASSGWTPGR